MEKNIQSMQTNSKEQCREKIVFSILAVFMLLGDVYSFPLIKSIGMGELVFILSIPYFIIKLNARITVSSKYAFFYIYMIYGFVVSIIMGALFNASFSEIGIRIVRDLFYYFLIFILGAHYFDTHTFCKWVIRFSTILALFVILQSVIYMAFGYFIPGFPMNAAINNGGYIGREIYSQYLTYARIAGYLKPNGFLCEPAHCAQCFFVSLIIILYDDMYEKTSMRNAIIISVAAVLTMSTSAFIYVALAWMAWIIKEGKRNALKVILFVVLIIGLGFILYNKGSLDNMNRVISRLTNVFSGNPITRSSELRLIKGLSTFLLFPIFIKIFGIGFGTYNSIIHNFTMSSITMAESEYMSTFSYIFVSSGIIGAFLMLVALWSVFKNAPKLSKMMVLAMIVMSLGSSIYSSAIIVWIMLIVLYYSPSREQLY